MPIATMTLDDGAGGNPVTLTTRNFNAGDQDNFLDNNWTSFRGQLALAGFDANNLAISETIVSHGVTVDFYRAPNRPRTKYSDMKDGVIYGLGLVTQDPNLTFPGNRLQVFCSEESNVSLGFRYRKNATEYAAITMGKTSWHWSGDDNTKTVAMEVKTHYQKAWFTSSSKRRCAATAVHEMGHIFHQIGSLPHYILMARVSVLAGQAISIEAVDDSMHENIKAPKLLDFNPQPTPAQLYHFVRHSRRWGTGVSNYAAFNGMNEFVAETFCSLVMGSPIGGDNHVPVTAAHPPDRTDVLAAYTEHGGPLPALAARHARRG